MMVALKAAKPTP